MRHGQAEHNKAWLLNETNQKVSNLTPQGREEVKENAQKLADSTDIDIIYCSPLIRCQQTAQIMKEVYHQSNLKIETKTCLAEFKTGYNNRSPLLWSLKLLFSQNRLNKKFHNGQSLAESKQALEKFLDQITAQHPQEKVLIVAHLITFQMLYRIFYNQDLKISWPWRQRIYIGSGEIQEFLPPKSK